MVRSTSQSRSRENKGYIEQLAYYTMKSRYNILRNDKVIFEDLSEMEYFDMMEDLAVEFYQTGTPHPDEITYEIVE